MAPMSNGCIEIQLSVGMPSLVVAEAGSAGKQLAQEYRVLQCARVAAQVLHLDSGAMPPEIHEPQRDPKSPK